MQSDHQVASHALPPHVQLIQIGTAFLASRTVYAAAKLGLADQLAAGPKSATELAGTMRAHAPSLHRLMRTLASLGILKEQSERRYALTTLGEALKSGAPGSATLAALGSPWLQDAWDHVVHSVQTGKTGFEKAQGMPLFDYLAQHSEDASLFSEAMLASTAKSRQPSPLRMIFRPSKLLLMSAVLPVTCWRQSSPDTPDHVACCSTDRTWWPTHLRCSKQRA